MQQSTLKVVVVFSCPLEEEGCVHMGLVFWLDHVLRPPDRAGVGILGRLVLSYDR